MGIIKTCSEYLNESVWGDLRKRSSGEVTRREDNVNDLDEDDFLSYLKNKYTVYPLQSSSFSYGNEKRASYSIEILRKSGFYVYVNLSFESDKLQEIRIDYNGNDKEDFRNKFLPQLNDNFDVKDIDDRFNTYSIVKSKTGEINNNVVIDIFDLIIDFLDNDGSINVNSRIEKKS